MISLMCGISKHQAHGSTGYTGDCQGLWNGGNEMMLVKRYTFPVIRGMNSGALMYSMMTVVNNTVLYA